MSDRLSSLSSMQQTTNMRGRVGSQSTDVTMRPGVGGVPATTLPQAMQMMRSVQTSLDWVLKKQVCYCH